MKKYILLLLTILSFTAYSQTSPTLPNGAKPYGNQLYILPSTGDIWGGNAGYKYRVVAKKSYVDSLNVLGYKKTQVDSLLALKAPSTGSANYINNTASLQSAQFNIDGRAKIGSLAINTSSTNLAPIHVGNRNVLNSTDAQILIARNIGNTAGEYLGSGHAFSDGSLLNRSGFVSYNSFDARINIGGTYNYGHYAAFQASPTISTTGQIDNIYNLFTSTDQTSGTIVRNFGAYLASPTGNVNIISNYGVYADTSTRGTVNYGGYYRGQASASNHIPLATYTFGSGNTSPLLIQRDNSTGAVGDKTFLGFTLGNKMLTQHGMEIRSSIQGDAITYTRYNDILAERTRTTGIGFGINLAGVAPAFALDVNGDIAQVNSRILSNAGYIGFLTRAGAANLIKAGKGYFGSSFGGTQTAILQIQAGAATAGSAPIKLTSGVNLTTPEAGTIEYDGSNIFFTPSSTRKTFAFLEDLSIVNTTTTALSSATLNSTYPNVPVGFRVICHLITGAPAIYTKATENGSSDVWLTTLATVTP